MGRIIQHSRPSLVSDALVAAQLRALALSPPSSPACTASPVVAWDQHNQLTPPYPSSQPTMLPAQRSVGHVVGSLASHGCRSGADGETATSSLLPACLPCQEQGRHLQADACRAASVQDVWQAPFEIRQQGPGGSSFTHTGTMARPAGLGPSGRQLRADAVPGRHGPPVPHATGAKVLW